MKRSRPRSQRATPPPSVPIHRSPLASSAMAHTTLLGSEAGSAASRVYTVTPPPPYRLRPAPVPKDLFLARLGVWVGAPAEVLLARDVGQHVQPRVGAAGSRAGRGGHHVH